MAGTLTSPYNKTLHFNFLTLMYLSTLRLWHSLSPLWCPARGSNSVLFPPNLTARIYPQKFITRTPIYVTIILILFFFLISLYQGFVYNDNRVSNDVILPVPWYIESFIYRGSTVNTFHYLAPSFCLVITEGKCIHSLIRQEIQQSHGGGKVPSSILANKDFPKIALGHSNQVIVTFPSRASRLNQLMIRTPYKSNVNV